MSLLDADTRSLARVLDAACTQWAASLGVAEDVEAARRITLAHFSDWQGRLLDGREAKRVSAYFGAVVRRRVVRGTSRCAMQARRQLVVASIERDLREAGWSKVRASAEAHRLTGMAAVESGAA
jgi:hypothetical protein